MNDFMIMLQKSTVSVPALELVLLLVSLSVCMLFRYSKAGLVIAFLFCMHMGYVFCQSELANNPTYQPYITVYFVFGALVLLFAILGMVWTSGSSSD